jgi:DHA1 family inner membrane transport protein
MILSLIWSVAGTLFYAPQQQRLVAIDLERRSILLALNASALYIGMSLGSFIAGLAYHRLGAGPLPVASLLLLVLAGWAFSASRHAGP